MAAIAVKLTDWLAYGLLKNKAYNNGNTLIGQIDQRALFPVCLQCSNKMYKIADGAVYRIQAQKNPQSCSGRIQGNRHALAEIWKHNILSQPHYAPLYVG